MGSFGGIEQAIGCLLCDPGTFADEEGMGDCPPCSPGYFAEGNFIFVSWIES